MSIEPIEPVFYQSLPAQVHEEMLHSHAVTGGTIDLTVGDGKLALQHVISGIPYFGITLSENHTKAVKSDLVKGILKLMKQEGNNLYNPGYLPHGLRPTLIAGWCPSPHSVVVWDGMLCCCAVVPLCCYAVLLCILTVGACGIRSKPRGIPPVVCRITCAMENTGCTSSWPFFGVPCGRQQLAYSIKVEQSGTRQHLSGIYVDRRPDTRKLDLHPSRPVPCIHLPQSKNHLWDVRGAYPSFHAFPPCICHRVRTINGTSRGHNVSSMHSPLT